VPDLEQVFKDLREDVSRQTVASAAAEQYKLALTYRDMGMLDEAMRALEQAVRSPRLRFEAASMLAKIYADRGMDHEAVEWFERAAEAPAPTVDAGRALLYDLGQTLEKTGEAARALAVFLELQSDAGEYRDVSARIQRLSKAQTRG
jgi:tetratricopeptide (TPR) repeat protein